MIQTRLLSSVFVLFATLMVVGCGSSKPTPVPVKGKVNYRKTTPPAGALIVFHPTDPEVEKVIGGKPFGKVKEDGTFTLTTYNEDDGAPPGDYHVTIDWKVPKEGKMGFGIGEGANMVSKLNPRYSNPQQPVFKETVKKDGKNEFIFEVD